MKSLVALVAASVLLAAPAAFAGDGAVEAPIQRMMNGFNKGDIAAAKAVHVASPIIVDEMAPFAWSGPKAFDNWLGDLVKSGTTEGKTDGVVWFGTPVREIIVGDHAYVVTPCTYTFKQKGQTLRETGTTTFVLVKDASDWKIEAWTWASPEAAPVK